MINTVMKKFWNWLLSLFSERWELTVWFQADNSMSRDGEILKTRSSKKVFVLKSVSKKTPTHVKGIDEDNKSFEIRTVKPFDYMLRRLD